ncbi:unnamed protein product [Ectocarpus sp. CCAP 1310/34]|nr:unnamed protein product [Ectocarpus sp. CCAP 1310/34]
MPHMPVSSATESVTVVEVFDPVGREYSLDFDSFALEWSKAVESKSKVIPILLETARHQGQRTENEAPSEVFLVVLLDLGLWRRRRDFSCRSSCPPLHHSFVVLGLTADQREVAMFAPPRSTTHNSFRSEREPNKCTVPELVTVKPSQRNAVRMGREYSLDFDSFALEWSKAVESKSKVIPILLETAKHQGQRTENVSATPFLFVAWMVVFSP